MGILLGLLGAAGAGPRSAWAQDGAAAGDEGPGDSTETDDAADATEAAPAAPPSTFEELERTAAPLSDLAMLLTPFSGACSDSAAGDDAPAGGARAIDRSRCRVGREYLKHVLPQRTFSTVVEDPLAVALSDYDAGVKGFRLSVAGCLACTRPVRVAAESRLVTVKVPEEKVTSLRAATEVSKNTVGFDTLADAQAWRTETGSDLRAQFVFRSDPRDFAIGPQKGFALPLVGFRVFNRCSGEVLVARPRSGRVATLPGMSAGCQRRRPTAGTGTSTGKAADNQPAGLVPRLSKNDINKAMSTIRAQVMACFEKFNVPGMAQLDYIVSGNGSVLSIGVSGAFQGTPTGACVLDAARDARFPQFAREREQFTYPFFLRR